MPSKTHHVIFLSASVMALIGCGQSQMAQNYPDSFSLVANNSASIARLDEAVSVQISGLNLAAPDFNPKAFVVLDGERELASQADDLDGDGRADHLTFVTDFTPSEQKSLTIRYARSGDKPRGYVKRTQAELSRKVGGQWQDRKYIGGEFQNVRAIRVPDEHTDHSFFFRYEGPGWESDMVGYRFYLDWRNATDIFGKKTSEVVLQNAGQDNFDSYHEMADWGMDILKVGESLGIGSIGSWDEGKVFRVSETDSVTCEIVSNGPVYSHIRTNYFGWNVGSQKYDLSSNLSITAGSRLTKHEVEVTGTPSNLCTGLVKHEQAELFSSSNETGQWAYLALFGQQSLAEDNLGMAVLYKKSDLIQPTEDEWSHVLVLKPSSGKLTYYFVAAWEKEPNGIKTKEEFQQYLQHTVERLNSPIAVDLGEPKS